MNDSLPEKVTEDIPKEPPKEQFPEYVLLLKLISQLGKFKYRVAIIAILGAGAMLGYSLTVEDRYYSQARVAINLNDSPGGVNPSNFRGSNSIGVLEYDFIIDKAQSNELERYLARMESFAFVSLFINQENLLPWLYAKDWNEETKTWAEDSEPDMREAVKQFKELLYVGIDKKTDLLNVGVTAESPSRAASLANKYVHSFNDYLRNLELEELKFRRDYLENRLTEVTNTELHRSIFRLLESQLAVESLIFARTNFPLEMIQPATEPLFESYPARKKWTVLTLIGLLFMGFFAVIIIQVVSGFRSDLKEYAAAHPDEDKNAEASEKSDEDNTITQYDHWVDKNTTPDNDKRD